MLQLGPELFDFLNGPKRGNYSLRFGEGGMSENKILDVQKQLGFLLPKDFKCLLQNVQDPNGDMFDWNHFSKKRYDDLIEWVWKGIEFDISENCFWLENRWGSRPESMEDRFKIGRKDFETWPKLLPLFGHRFLPATPCLSDNPVFSIMQTDIIYYGSNLANYLINELMPAGGQATPSREAFRKIDVWSQITEEDLGRTFPN